MSRFIDLAGRRFGRLTVVSRAESTLEGQSQWNCSCDCGERTVVRGQCLRENKTKSCGCLQSEKRKNGVVKHKASNTRIYEIWETIKKRTTQKTRKDYKHYGGKGISVCEEWEKNFPAFYKWALQNGYADNLTIDRIYNDKGYNPQNCRWVDMKAQANNKSTNRYITYNGETKTMAEWGQRLGGNSTIIRDRIDKLGWSVEKALTTPVKKK